MEDLIKSLQIFVKYNKKAQTHCEHDILLVVGVETVSNEDEAELDKLGFFWDTEYDCWGSFRYGSA